MRLEFPKFVKVCIDRLKAFDLRVTLTSKEIAITGLRLCFTDGAKTFSNG